MLNENKYKNLVRDYWKEWSKKNSEVSSYFDNKLEETAKKGEEILEIPLIEEMRKLNLSNDEVKLYFKYIHDLSVDVCVRLKKEEDMSFIEFFTSYFTGRNRDGFFVEVIIK